MNAKQAKYNIVTLHHAGFLRYKNAVLTTPDTGIFVILLYYASAITLTVYFDSGFEKHRQVVNLSDLAVSLETNTVPPFMGCSRLHQYLQMKVQSGSTEKRWRRTPCFTKHSPNSLWTLKHVEQFTA